VKKKNLKNSERQLLEEWYTPFIFLNWLFDTMSKGTKPSGNCHPRRRSPLTSRLQSPACLLKTSSLCLSANPCCAGAFSRLLLTRPCAGPALLQAAIIRLQNCLKSIKGTTRARWGKQGLQYELGE
jgi:hypothetical protein